MDFLRSPWRYNYVRSAKVSGTSSCIFCIAESPEEDSRHLILYRGSLNFVIMNMFPYTAGHVMIAPYRHAGEFADADPTQLSEMMTLSQSVLAVLDEAYQPEGYNLGLNLGEVAGAGVKDHLHFHIVPRWLGDTNFMTVAAETRVLPEDLNDSYVRLRHLFDKSFSVAENS